MDREGYWEHFSHDADIGLRGVGKTLEEAFEMAGLALTAVITELEKVGDFEKISIECSADDKELLFWEWLNALIYEIDTKKILFSRFHVQFKENTLKAEVFGEFIDRLQHKPVVDVKGATMTELKVKKINEHWVAQCVVDV